jgi:hypothetical protein
MSENHTPNDWEVQKNFQKWFVDPTDPDPDVMPFSLEIETYNRFGRRRINTLERLLGLFKFGLVGGVSLGVIVGFFIVYLSYWGWYSRDWPAPIVFISLALTTGFLGGFYKGLLSKLRE